jgi:hypothetical protein
MTQNLAKKTSDRKRGSYMYFASCPRNEGQRPFSAALIFFFFFFPFDFFGILKPAFCLAHLAVAFALASVQLWQILVFCNWKGSCPKVQRRARYSAICTASGSFGFSVSTSTSALFIASNSEVLP